MEKKTKLAKLEAEQDRLQTEYNTKILQRAERNSYADSDNIVPTEEEKREAAKEARQLNSEISYLQKELRGVGISVRAMKSSISAEEKNIKEETQDDFKNKQLFDKYQKEVSTTLEPLIKEGEAVEKGRLEYKKKLRLEEEKRFYEEQGIRSRLDSDFGTFLLQ